MEVRAFFFFLWLISYYFDVFYALYFWFRSVVEELTPFSIFYSLYPFSMID
jgi:hypothetical protein